MSLESLMFNLTASANDRRRDAAIPLPEGVACHCDIPYRSGLLLDVYYPEGTQAPLPTIVSIHGGGYVYGNKEIYRRYGMDLARRGFAFVNFNYRLAPKHRFPAPLEDANAVMEWICRNAAQYHLEPNKVFVVGDSAGAQLASQYAAIVQNPDYAALFPFRTPPITIRALGLNCGRYDMAAWAAEPRKGLMLDYLGRDLPAGDPRFRVLDAIGGNYPPVFIATACHDFLRDQAQPMYELLTARGVSAEMRCYGSAEDKTVAHVFHVNIRLPEAVRCNDDECSFFANFID
ncbi:MAG: alpha/beta hydrolase [Oscillospiraceae bacterium]|nr:alpha/beta hydrolase [Oscillospiraceae bacterium]